MIMADPYVCIIGAGPAGLAAARNLKLRGIAYRQFERHSGVGGIWDISNPGTPMYPSAHFISSRDRSGFYGFPMPAHFPDYPGQKLILSYTNGFADAYDLRASIEFSTHITHVEKANDGWRVTPSNGGSSHFSHVICASGHTWDPNWPSYSGAFSGKAMHAVDYSSSSIFKGMRVLIVGAGNSACDIACDAAQTADAAFISMRRGYHFVPKHIFGVPADVFAARSNWMPFGLRRAMFESLLRLWHGDLTRLGLKAPDHRVLASHPIINSQLIHHLQHGDIAARPDIERLRGETVVFSDGRRECVDLIIYATGYRYSIPYADASLFDWDGNKPDLAYTVFNRRNPTLFAAGFTEMNAGGYYIFDEMTALIADAIAMERDRPDAWKTAWRSLTDPIDLSGPLQLIPSDRHAGYVDMDTFLRSTRVLRQKLGWADPKQALSSYRASPAPPPSTLQEERRA